LWALAGPPFQEGPVTELIRPKDALIFVRALEEASRYIGALTLHTNGDPVQPEELRPPDPQPFLEAFETATLRLKTLDVMAYEARDASVDLFAALVRLFAITRRFVMPDVPADVSRRLAVAMADCQVELARLRVVYIAPEEGMEGGWAFLGETADLPPAPDRLPEEMT
jgi:hypothetical protein